MDERGSAVPAVVVVLLGGLLALGLALDLGLWSATLREAAFAADAGAEAGAAMLEAAAGYGGELVLDVPLAEQTAVAAALAARPRAGRSASARADAAQVCVAVGQPFSPTLLRLAGVGATQVTAQACATPGQG